MRKGRKEREERGGDRDERGGGREEIICMH